jgi:adenylate cyclase
MDLEGWETVGLYDPGAPEAEERLALLEYLTERGATVEQMVEAHRLGTLPAVAGDLVLQRSTFTVSVEEAAALCGQPVERILRILLALGLPMDADSTLPQGTGELITAFEQGAALMGEEAILAFTRVLGAAAINIAEAAVALFYSELGPGSGREGSDELARAQNSERATLALTSVPDVLSRVLYAQFDRAARRSALARDWTTPSGGHNEQSVTRGGEYVALGFVDLVGSTRWAEGLSLRDQSLALSRFESAAWSSAVLAGGRVVKMIGDEVFFAAPTADAACRIGIEVCQAAADDPLLPPARGAIGYGLVTPREGDFFGPLVNLISRLVGLASPGELVATESTAEALSDGLWTLRELDPQLMQRIESPVRVFALSISDSSPT